MLLILKKIKEIKIINIRKNTNDKQQFGVPVNSSPLSAVMIFLNVINREIDNGKYVAESWL